MTEKRDESRDVGVHEDFDTMRPWIEVGDDYRFERYVPHSQYAALEAESASLSELLDKQTENMLALREFVQRIADDDFDEFGANLIYEASDLIAKVTR